ncbi:hypothetical protein RHIZ404_230308 [Rhizobium sp. EC-SD404]|nr:hypothetical protein RHIZ404_230308 [Rhizobium sp. EC-SD404]
MRASHGSSSALQSKNPVLIYAETCLALLLTPGSPQPNTNPARGRRTERHRGSGRLASRREKNNG